ncbi:hypothetical protein IHE45_10G024000 [Dioscorea alata]|uniref:Uncharacterized protein n=1 Tax=Dioscorea alata TaxID=55571 RepID=A0ACB7V9G5_DIOAL|nr:hypothetical protein IHE45_10G024000 [Dioscorea alata]
MPTRVKINRFYLFQQPLQFSLVFLYPCCKLPPQMCSSSLSNMYGHSES